MPSETECNDLKTQNLLLKQELIWIREEIQEQHKMIVDLTLKIQRLNYIILILGIGIFGRDEILKVFI